ncbi:MAG: hypothetical protein N2485_04620 [bacterium]|nr:hypothetical protein [bacterium]
MENLTSLRPLNEIITLLLTGIIGTIIFLIIMNFIYKNRYTKPEDTLKYFKRNK